MEMRSPSRIYGSSHSQESFPFIINHKLYRVVYLSHTICSSHRIIMHIQLHLCTIFLAQAFTTLFYQVATMRRSLNALTTTINSLTLNKSSKVRSHSKHRASYIRTHSKYETSHLRSHSWIRHSIPEHNRNRAFYSISHSKNRASYPRSHNTDKVVYRIRYKAYLISSFQFISNFMHL